MKSSVADGLRFAFALPLFLSGCAATSPAVGKPAAPFELATLAGPKLSLAALPGKVALLDFWASWCGPCREELPALERLRAEYEPKGVSFVTVNVDNERGAAEEMAARLGLKMPVVLDDQKVVASAYNLPTMPTSYVLERAGGEGGWLVRFVHEGYSGKPDLDKFRRELDGLLAK